MKLKYLKYFVFLRQSVVALLQKLCYFLYLKNISLTNNQLKMAYKYAIRSVPFKEAFGLKIFLMTKQVIAQDLLSDLELNALKSAIELGKFDLAKRWIEVKNTKKLKSDVLSEFVAFIDLHIGEGKKWEDWSFSIGDAEDDRARHSLIDARVLFYGPAPGADLKNIHSDSFDYVALINYTGRIGFDFNAKPIISYYNGQRLNEEWGVIAEALRKVSMVFPKPKSIGMFSEKILTASQILRASKSPVNVMFASQTPNNFQNGVYDLLFLNVRNLFITGFNFWCSKQAWEKGYKPEGYAHYNSLSKSIRSQDPLSNFLFIKNLYNNNLIKLGDDAKKIVELDVNEYAEILDDLYPC